MGIKMSRALIILAIIAISFVSAEQTGFLQLTPAAKFQTEIELKSIDLKTVEAFLDGFATASTLYDHLPALQECKAYDKEAIQTIIDVVMALPSLDWKTIVQAIGNAMKAVEDVVKRCDNKGLFTQFKQMLADIDATLTDKGYVLKVIEHLTANIFKVVADVQAIIADFKAGDAKKAGTDIGDLLKKTFIVA